MRKRMRKREVTPLVLHLLVRPMAALPTGAVCRVAGNDFEL